MFKMATEIEEALTCPYINKEKAALFGTAYFCDFDNMEFESMPAHCGQCEMYWNIMKKAEALVLGDDFDG